MQSTEDYRAEKAKRITEVNDRFMAEVMRIKSALYRLNKKRPRICIRGSKLKAKRIIARKKIFLLVQLMVISNAARLQYAIILSQPIPKFKLGVYNNEQATTIDSASNEISERWQEFIINPASLKAHAIPPLPPRQRGDL